MRGDFRRLTMAAAICCSVCAPAFADDPKQVFLEQKKVLLLELHAKNPETRTAALAKIAALPSLETAKAMLEQCGVQRDADMRRSCLKSLRGFADVEGVPEWLAADLGKKIKSKPLLPSDHLRYCTLLAAKEELGRGRAAAVTEEILQTQRGLLYLIGLVDSAADSFDADERGLIVSVAAHTARCEHAGLRRALAQSLTKVGRQDATDVLAAMLPEARGELRADISRYFVNLSRGGGNWETDWAAWWKDRRATQTFDALGKETFNSPEPYGTPHYHGLPLFGSRLVFVVDTSGSMRGGRLETAKAELIKTIGELPPGVQFNVLAFNEVIIPWQRRSLAVNSAENKQAAARFVAAFEPGGGTASYDALEAALAYPADSICFLTDGVPEGGKTADVVEIIARITAANRVCRATIHTIGIGPVNAAFLEALAARNFGKYRELK